MASFTLAVWLLPARVYPIETVSPGRRALIAARSSSAELMRFLTGLLDGFSEKYGRVIRERIRSTPEAMIDEYPTTIRLTPRRVRAW